VSKKNREPTWNLTENYGCYCDAYNWVLQKKSGKNWKAIGYYPTPEKMLAGLYRKTCRTEAANPYLLIHLNKLQERVQAVAAHLSDELNRMAWSHLHRPPARPKPTTRRRNYDAD